MVKVIEIDLDDKLEYLNKYDDNIINDELHKYILNVFDEIKCNILLRIKFNYSVGKEELSKIELLFKRSFSVEIDNIKNKLKKQNTKDITMLFLGFLFLIIYCCLDDFNIFLVAEFFMVTSWVFLWKVIESLLFDRRVLIINKKKYEKLINAEFEIVD